MGNRVVFLVPRRDDGGHRDALWAYCKARWERLFPEWPIIEGHHDDGPFNRSAAVNLASELAGNWDIGIVIDSDVIISQSLVTAAVRWAEKSQKITWPHTRIRNVTAMATDRIIKDKRDMGEELDRDAIDLIVDRTNPISWSCCIVIPRSQYDALGGFDERFKGWGFEDMAFQSAVCGLLGWNRQHGDIVHLWHPRSDDRINLGDSRRTASPEYVYNARLGRRYMVALRRDHDIHDRGGRRASPEERERDIDNLLKDDAKWSGVAKRLGQPDWDDWWPTLQELVDGARAYRREGALRQSVAVVVRSGGTLDVASERLGYLDRTLRSLNEMVTGPIEQRVVYSDWPEEVVGQVKDIAERYGFYVVGSGHHGYIGSTQRLWRYIDARVKTDFVFLAEDDFTYLKAVDLDPMIGVLSKRPNIRQIALLRPPVYAREIDLGGILGWDRSTFNLRADNDHPWLEHRNFWTMNPSLFRKDIVRRFPWPAQQNSERIFGTTVLKDAAARVAFWGSGEEWIEHIGVTRAGGPY